MEVFELFLNEEMLSLLVQSVLYARPYNRHEFTSAISKMRSFVSFLLFTCYHKFSGEEMYWSLDPDCNTATVRQALSRKRFRNIKTNLHRNDKYNTYKVDKLFIVRSYMELLNKNFKSLEFFRQTCLFMSRRFRMDMILTFKIIKN